MTKQEDSMSRHEDARMMLGPDEYHEGETSGDEGVNSNGDVGKGSTGMGVTKDDDGDDEAAV